MSLINLDTKSLLGVLIWGNIATGIIVYLYQKLNTQKTDYNIMRGMTIIRFLYAVGYALLFFRGDMHEFISVNIGNTLLFSCYYVEVRIMLELINANAKRTINILSAILVIDLLAFNLSEFYYKDASLRVALASIIIFSIFLLPTILLLTSKIASTFKKGVSIFYLFLLCALIPRSIEPFLYRSVDIHTNNYYQTLLFISLTLIMISTTIVYLLFMKERTDMLIEKMATFDSLTNVLNRHSFFIRGKHAFENHKQSGQELSLLFFDIDHFKRVNDLYGHQFGDEALIQFANIVKNNVRPNDLCCRYGGEEFIVLLMNANETISQNVAIRIMQEIEKYTFPSHPDLHITTSVGSISGIPQNGELLEDYIQMGDQAVYRAKRSGRNKLVVYDDKIDKSIFAEYSAEG